MEFINQSLNLPKKTSPSVLNETYHEISLQDMVSQHDGSAVLSPPKRKEAFSNRKNNSWRKMTEKTFEDKN